MICKEIAKITFNSAVYLDPKVIRYSKKYSEDLGSWGLDENKLDELKRNLSKLKAELKVYELNEKEFPTLKNKELVELEIKSDDISSKKIVEILKKLKAFPLEKHHVINLKKKLN
jgi:hypothetical protein